MITQAFFEEMEIGALAFFFIQLMTTHQYTYILYYIGTMSQNFLQKLQSQLDLLNVCNF